MRKKLLPITLTALLIAVLIPGSLSAGVGEVKVLAGAGYAFSDYEGPMFMAGLEVEAYPGLFVQAMFDFLTDPLPDSEETYGGNYKVTGLNLFGLYKLKPSEKLSMFVKAGVGYSTLKAQADVGGGVMLNVGTVSDFAVAGGVGFEVMLSERVGVIFGGNVNHVFAEAKITWFAAYGGVTFKIK